LAGRPLSSSEVRFERFRSTGVSKKIVLLAWILVFARLPLRAQTIRVDAKPERATNSIVPTRALGAGIDRLPYGATDKLFVDPMVKEVLSAGWQTVSYRQNTELHMEAWHWNPVGTWSDPEAQLPAISYATLTATPCRIAASRMMTAQTWSDIRGLPTATQIRTGKAIRT
jgi:hypothetical protein